MTFQTIQINGQRPGCISKQRAVDFLDGEHKLIDRMLWASRNQPQDPWIIIARNKSGRPGQAVKIDTASFEAAYRRLLSGEEPPLLPSERISKAKSRRLRVRKNNSLAVEKRRRRKIN
jgi:hypothetical protein